MIATRPSRPATPDWLVQPEVAMCPCGCIGKRKKGSFVEKTLKGGTSLMRQAIFSEDVAAQPGLLQQLDARVKLVTLLGLLVVAALARSVVVLLAIYAAVLALGVVSGLSLVFFIKRVWLFIPIFTGIVVLPATLNLVTPGTIVVPLGTWFGHQVGLTSEGLHGAGDHHRAGRSLDLAGRAPDPHHPVDAPPGRAPGAVRAQDVHPRAGHGLPLPVPPPRLGDGHVHGAHVAHGGPRCRRGLGAAVRRGARPARCSARRTGCRTRCTWPCWPAATTATRGR